MAAHEFDVLIIGAGIAGASAAAHLAHRARVAVLEREEHPGYHSTGRSAALFSETYGNAVVRALSRASREFLFSPPQGFSEYPLVSPRGALFIARADQEASLARFLSEPDVAANAHRITAAEAARRCSILREGYAIGGAYEADAHDIDVNAVHQGFLRELKAHGGVLVCGVDCGAMKRVEGKWQIATPAGDFEAPVVVNAAGAWADEIAVRAGTTPLGITPCRRTAILVEAGLDLSRMPLVIDMDEEFYFKPDAGMLLISPADETPTPPCDVQPDELDIAIAIDRVQNATTLAITRVSRKWAGLRSFAPDRSLVIGFDRDAEGFFWLAGQGGYGIQTAPAAGRVAAELILNHSIAPDIMERGVSADLLSPKRFAGVSDSRAI